MKGKVKVKDAAAAAAGLTDEKEGYGDERDFRFSAVALEVSPQLAGFEYPTVKEFLERRDVYAAHCGDRIRPTPLRAVMNKRLLS